MSFDTSLLAVAFIVLVALTFDFVNGFHDAANSIATIVSTRVLTPLQAVVWAAFFNFVAFLFFGLHVATTVGKGIVATDAVTPQVVLAGLVGAITWDLITWYVGLPTSSSHALTGGFVGAAFMYKGLEAIIFGGVGKIALFIVVSPLVGMAVGLCIIVILTWLFRRFVPSQVRRWFGAGQLMSAAAFSLGHGTNDAQKTMGIISVLLFTSGYLGPEFRVPLWVVLSAHLAIAMGTLAGGWRIVKTMGLRITKLQTYHGFSAETAAAATLFSAAAMGIPVSTTHTIAGAILGVGSVQRLSAVRWGIAGRMIWAWIFTIPMSALIAAATYIALDLVF
ncbi:MAG: inorganic phosphate transporter [Dehalococcoidia bacterium]|nr:inorganic phosphate transporter [Dehalococcoidia bacterium]